MTEVASAVQTILGIDPGSRITGFGVVGVENGKIWHIDHGRIRATGKERGERLVEIYQRLSDVLALHKPGAVAMEEVFMATNPSSALVLGQARGVILGACIGKGLRVHDYPSTQIKRMVTSDGHASKHKVQFMVRVILELTETPEEDAADALAAAICHHRSLELDP